MPAGASAALAMAMGPGLVWVTDARHHASHAIEGVAVLMAAYLVLCCAIALLLHLTSVSPDSLARIRKTPSGRAYLGMSARHIGGARGPNEDDESARQRIGRTP